MASRKPRRQRGFTLLEILVVFVIVGFVASILLQALSQVYRLQERFGQESLRSQDGAMRAEWFRHALEGLLTALPGDPAVFHGEPGMLSGFSLGGVDLDGGAPSRFEMVLRYDEASRLARLTYRRIDGGDKDAKSMELMVWETDAAPSLAYVDQRDQAHDVWPPAFGVWPQLPKMIMLKGRLDGDEHWIAAAPLGPTEPARVPALSVLMP